MKRKERQEKRKKKKKNKLPVPTPEMTFLDHMKVLQKKLVFLILFIVIMFVLAFTFRDYIMDFIRAPITGYDIDLHYFKPQDKLITYFKVSGFAGLMFSLPVILFQVTSYAFPALTDAERRAFVALDFIIPLFFLGGAALAYYFVGPTALDFFINFNQGDEVIALWGISEYVTLLISLIFGIGVIFLAPLVMIFLVRLGILPVRIIIKGRKIALFGSFLVGALLTPPDVVTQLIIGGVLILLYEFTIFISKMIVRRKNKQEGLDPNTGIKDIVEKEEDDDENDDGKKEEDVFSRVKRKRETL